jgi:copper homeostasis protein CutC
MASSIHTFGTSGLLSPGLGDGFVLGVLHRQGDDGRVVLDGERNRELVRLAEGFGLRCVLHRAVDDVLSGGRADEGRVADVAGDDGDSGAGSGGGRDEDKVKEVKDVEGVVEEMREIGFDGVLTSGGRGDAVGNVEGLGAVVRAARREKVEVIVGGGVRKGDLAGLVESLGGDGLEDGVWFHSSCLRNGETFDVEEAKGLAEGLRELGVVLSDQV